jgi:hypothetical protein
MPIKNITIEVIRKIGFISYFFNYYFSRNFIFNNWICIYSPSTKNIYLDNGLITIPKIGHID